jgi:hypothetical protein
VSSRRLADAAADAPGTLCLVEEVAAGQEKGDVDVAVASIGTRQSTFAFASAYVTAGVDSARSR